ncbi:MAG: peptide chain release factor 2 [Spirochaetaceae bacterium]|nr:peptide chain release factor 2 [Spirochaetaceae bacterium]
MLLQELYIPIKEMEETISVIRRRLDEAGLAKKISALEAECLKDGFWNDAKEAEKTLGELKKLKLRVEPWVSLSNECEDLSAHLELALEAGEESEAAEIEQKLSEIKTAYEKQYIIELMPDEIDANSCFLTIHSGAGGTEANDWAGMLYRMYLRWSEKHGFSVESVDFLEAEGGLKSATIRVNGPYAYGRLKCETGVHRLVRISPFDANSRRHTSFASVYAFPVLDDSIEVEIKPDDLRVDTYRSSGAGGQHVNKTDSAVRFTHIPTGIVAACQSERSQTMNRALAMSMLKARLYEHYKQEQEKEKEKFAAEKKDISWSNQIRNYVFQPYTLVKDARTKVETGNIQAVMDGGIDVFIEAFLKMQTLQ